MRWRSCSTSASRSTGPDRWAARRCTTPPGGATATWWRYCSSAGPTRTARNTRGRSPLATAARGSFHSPGPIAGGGTDHLRIAELLVAAGATVEPEMIDSADEELAEWLRERVLGG